jgi:hypothetical protein
MGGVGAWAFVLLTFGVMRFVSLHSPSRVPRLSPLLALNRALIALIEPSKILDRAFLRP